MAIDYNVYSIRELKAIVSNLSVDNKTMNIPVYQDFDYFSPNDLENDDEGSLFIIASDYESNEVIGVMKIKRYAIIGHSYVSEEERYNTRNYIAIRYVNTKKEWKQNGIATGLYDKLNSISNLTDTVVGSPLTNDGKLAKLNNLREEIICNCESYSSLAEYEEVFYENHPELL